MSLRAMLWALYDAPTAGLPPGAFRVLLVLADHAHDDGTSAFPAASSVADKIGVTRRTVERHIATLRDAGLIRPGDQQLVAHIRADRRPVVWDLDLARSDRTVGPHGPTPVVGSTSHGPTETAPRSDSARRHGPTPVVGQNRPRTKEPTRARARATTSPLCAACGFEHDATIEACRPAVPMPAAIRDLIHAAPVRTP